MKKLLALVLALAMVFCFVACDKDDDKTKDDKSASSSQSENSGSTSTEKLPAQSGSGEFVAGTVSGNTYENEYLGLGIKLEGDWTFASSSDLASMSTDDAVYDLFAQNTTTGSAVNVTVEKYTKEFMATLDLDEVYNNIIGAAEAALESQGGTNFEPEIGEVTIGGKDFDAIAYSVTISGVEVYVAQVITTTDTCLAAIAISGSDPEYVTELVDCLFVA